MPRFTPDDRVCATGRFYNPSAGFVDVGDEGTVVADPTPERGGVTVAFDDNDGNVSRVREDQIRHV